MQHDPLVDVHECDRNCAILCCDYEEVYYCDNFMFPDIVSHMYIYCILVSHTLNVIFLVVIDVKIDLMSCHGNVWT